MTAMGVREIREVGVAAFAWLSAHRGEFALGEDALTGDGHVDATWKPLGELVPSPCSSASQQYSP
ncbi:hypothetical protein ABZ078_25625 [Streptomyces sp. NPDC006385]|uniref:hypothetical protein n=1 Tax=Streptomyces sp. NPDC006385 TaxID=3156761 RepID=UPI0033BF3180